MPTLLAHQGGWDELLWFAVPIVLVVIGVRWAEKRAGKGRSEGEEAVANMPDESTP